MSLLKAKNQLIKEIAEREGKKHQASVGDIREIIKIICFMQANTNVFRGDGRLFTALDLVAEIADTLKPQKKLKLLAKAKRNESIANKSNWPRDITFD